MKMESLSVVLPSRRVTNDEVIDIIASNSKNFQGDLSRTLRHISLALRKSGSNARRWLGDEQTAFELTLEACRKAMDRIEATDRIDLLIYASVFSELTEPATSNLIARRLGLDAVECFDIKEACDGWMKAVKIASAFIESGTYRRIMIVNSEFSMVHGYAINPKLFSLDSADQIEWRFPAYTIGEAVTATILGPDPSNLWRHYNATRNDLFDLCTVTTPWTKATSDRMAKDGLGMFTSYGADLRHHGFPLAIEAFKRSRINPSDVDFLATHSSSKKDWTEGAKVIGLIDKFYDIYAEYGNVVSAAIPAALALAEQDGTLRRGHKVAAWVASAGMSFSTAHFKF